MALQKAHRTFLTTSTWAKGMKLPALTLWNHPLMFIIIMLAGSLCAPWFQNLHICWVPLSLKIISQDTVPDCIPSRRAGKPSLQTSIPAWFVWSFHHHGTGSRLCISNTFSHSCLFFLQGLKTWGACFDSHRIKSVTNLWHKNQGAAIAS